MKKSILQLFFSSGLQAIAVQVLGVLFIAIVAKVLPKEEFGIIQTANTIAMFVTTLLSFGMEQVVVRRIAASSTSDWAAAAFLFHNFIGSILALLVITVLSFLFKDNPAVHFLPLFFAAQSLLFLVIPLKQFLNAKHMFAPYGVIAVLSNVCKIGLAILLYKKQTLTITSTGSVWLICSGFELFALLLYVHRKTGFRLKFRIKAYKKLVKESMPQYLSVVFDSSLSRLDIILVGIISTYVATADYSFAYRGYEMARLPIVVVAPVILNVFARMMHNRLSDVQKAQVRSLYNIEIFLSMLIPLVLNILWSPVLNYFFDDKFGSTNSAEFMLLSVCIPLQFFINLLWTISFSAKKYRQIATITMLSAIINLLLNLILIPAYGGIGAAWAYLITTLFQSFAYYLLVNKHLMKIPLYTLFRFMALASLVYYSVHYWEMHIILQILVCCLAYVIICFATGWVTLSQVKSLKQYMFK